MMHSPVRCFRKRWSVHDAKALFEADWDGKQWKLGQRVAYQDW